MNAASTGRRIHAVAALVLATGVAGCSATSVDGAGGASGPAKTASVKPARMAAGDGRIIIGHPAVPNLGCHAIVVERVGPVPAGVKARFEISFGAFFAKHAALRMIAEQHLGDGALATDVELEFDVVFEHLPDAELGFEIVALDLARGAGGGDGGVEK